MSKKILQHLRRAPDIWMASALAAATLFLSVPYAIGGIANTKHNLSTGGNANNVRTTVGTDEICVFCHTPHAAAKARCSTG